jgi:hypothetical protein
MMIHSGSGSGHVISDAGTDRAWWFRSLQGGAGELTGSPRGGGSTDHCLALSQTPTQTNIYRDRDIELHRYRDIERYIYIYSFIHLQIS